MTTPTLYAYIDEAGQRSRSPKSSDHFVLSAVLIPDRYLAESSRVLAQLREQIDRPVDCELHWRNYDHSVKTFLTQEMAKLPWLTASNVVVCKRTLTGIELNDDQAYLYTVRLLLERLSWFARDNGYILDYTLAHIVRFKSKKLKEYEQILRLIPDCKIAWNSVNSRGGRIDQPCRIEQLQLADIVASATFQAFEADRFGNTERRYLEALSPRLYRRGTSSLTSYGMKLHPYNKAAYPWVAAL